MSPPCPYHSPEKGCPVSVSPVAKSLTSVAGCLGLYTGRFYARHWLICHLFGSKGTKLAVRVLASHGGISQRGEVAIA